MRYLLFLFLLVFSPLNAQAMEDISENVQGPTPFITAVDTLAELVREQIKVLNEQVIQKAEIQVMESFFPAITPLLASFVLNQGQPINASTTIDLSNPSQLAMNIAWMLRTIYYTFFGQQLTMPLNDIEFLELLATTNIQNDLFAPGWQFSPARLADQLGIPQEQLINMTLQTTSEPLTTLKMSNQQELQSSWQTYNASCMSHLQKQQELNDSQQIEFTQLEESQRNEIQNLETTHAVTLNTIIMQINQGIVSSEAYDQFEAEKSQAFETLEQQHEAIRRDLEQQHEQQRAELIQQIPEIPEDIANFIDASAAVYVAMCTHLINFVQQKLQQPAQAEILFQEAEEAVYEEEPASEEESATQASEEGFYTEEQESNEEPEDEETWNEEPSGTIENDQGYDYEPEEPVFDTNMQFN